MNVDVQKCFFSGWDDAILNEMDSGILNANNNSTAVINDFIDSTAATGSIRVYINGGEYGSNANGEFIRYPDGTLICWKSNHDAGSQAISTAFFGGFRSGGLGQTYPASFSARPAAAGGNYTANGLQSFGAAVGAASTTNWSFVFTAVTSQTAANRSLDLIATGRWL
jgi:hypothetical protein